jgi:hypothetical protein
MDLHMIVASQRGRLHVHRKHCSSIWFTTRRQLISEQYGRNEYVVKVSFGGCRVCLLGRSVRPFSTAPATGLFCLFGTTEGAEGGSKYEVRTGQRLCVDLTGCSADVVHQGFMGQILIWLGDVADAMHLGKFFHASGNLGCSA